MPTRSGSSCEHPGDGAKSKYSCGICNGECKTGSDQCGICPKWYHLLCAKVPVSVLPFIQTGKNKVEGLLWRCQSCQDNSNCPDISHIERAIDQVTEKLKNIANSVSILNDKIEGFSDNVEQVKSYSAMLPRAQNHQMSRKNLKRLCSSCRHPKRKQ